MHESYSLFNSWNAFFPPVAFSIWALVVWAVGSSIIICLSVVLSSTAVMPARSCLEPEGSHEVVVQNAWSFQASYNLSLSLYLFWKTLSILCSNLFSLSLGKLSWRDWFGHRYQMNTCQHDFAHILSLILLPWSDIIFYTRCEMSLDEGTESASFFL